MDRNILNEINRFREISNLSLIKEQREEITTSIELKNYLGEELYEDIKSFLEVDIVYNNELDKAKTIKCGQAKNVGAERIKVELSLECDRDELIMITKAPSLVVKGANMAKRDNTVNIMLSKSTVTKMQSAQIKINGESPSNFQITTTVGDLLDGKKFSPITISPKDLYGSEILDTNIDVTIYHNDTPIKIPNKDFGYRDDVNNNTYYFAKAIDKDKQTSIINAESKLQKAYKEKLYGEVIPSAIEFEVKGQNINYDTKRFIDEDGNIKYLTTAISTVESLSDKGSSQNNTGEDGNNTPQDAETQGNTTQDTETQGDTTQDTETQGDTTQDTETQGDTSTDTEEGGDEERDIKTVMSDESKKIKEEEGYVPTDMPNTWKDKILDGNKRVIMKGSHGYEKKYPDVMKSIAWVQNKLKDSSASNLKVDGYFGNNTKSAVVDYQNANDLSPADGKVGKNTLSKLLES